MMVVVSPRIKLLSWCLVLSFPVAGSATNFQDLGIAKALREKSSNGTVSVPIDAYDFESKDYKKKCGCLSLI